MELIPIQQISPDPIQPRRVLPEGIHQKFHGHCMPPSQALQALISIVQQKAGKRGVKFQNPFELLEWMYPMEQLSPEEQSLIYLVQLAVTLKDDGQVNPITVVDVSRLSGSPNYIIETGERRYWATWLLYSFHPDQTHHGKIPCWVVSQNVASPFRQARENAVRMSLNAVGMARQVALLLLHVHEYEIPAGPVSMDFYRQALHLDLRTKREFIELVYSSLGLTRASQLSEYKAILKLNDEALEIADRNNIEALKLRYVLMLEDSQDQLELIQMIVNKKLTVKQIRAILTETDSFERKTADGKSVLLLTKVLSNLEEDLNSRALAEALVSKLQDPDLTHARLQALQQLLAETAACITNEFL